MKPFSEILKALRIDRGITQIELAKRLGKSRSTIGMYETGEREPDYETLEALADYFNVDMNFILGKSDNSTALVTAEEISLIEKYRQLDQRGQQAVLDTLNREFDYMSNTVPVKFAALGGGVGTLNSTKESQEQIDKDIEAAQDYKPPFD